MSDPKPAMAATRVSIWSVTADVLPAYLTLFDILATIGVGYVVWYNIWELTADSVHATIWGIITGIVTVGIASGIITILILEIRKNAMIMGTYFERKIKRRRELELAEARAEAKEEARAEARVEARAEERRRNVAEFNALIDAWVKRRDESREKGEPFDEPPPRLEE